MSDSLGEIFAKQVSSIRKLRGLTQEQLALRAGLDRTYVSGIERCRRNVTIRTIESIAKALEVEPFRLLLNGGAE